MRVTWVLTCHRRAMDYDECLAKGYRIATGVVETAGSYLVKDCAE